MRYKSFLIMLICFVFIIGYWEKVEGAEFMDFGPYQGKVVDVKTKDPIEGVVVLIQWRKLHGFGGSTLIDTQETLTDKDGAFYIPGIWVLNPWAHLTSDARITIYKSGYKAIKGVFKKWKELKPTTKKYVLKVEDGKPIIMLKKLTLEERKRFSTPGTSDIPHEKKKLLIQEINKERKVFGLGEVTD